MAYQDTSTVVYVMSCVMVMLCQVVSFGKVLKLLKKLTSSAWFKIIYKLMHANPSSLFCNFPLGCYCKQHLVKSSQQSAGSVSSCSWLMKPQAISQSNEGKVSLLRWIYFTVVCLAVIHRAEPPLKHTLRRNRWQPLPGDATKTLHYQLVSSSGIIRARFIQMLVVVQGSIIRSMLMNLTLRAVVFYNSYLWCLWSSEQAN